MNKKWWYKQHQKSSQPDKPITAVEAIALIVVVVGVVLYILSH